MALRPEYANRRQGDEIVRIRPEDIRPGDILVVRPGERIPVDSIIVEGNSLADTSPLTGESLPKTVGPGEQVLGGYINKTGLLTIKAVSALEQSAVSRILKLVGKLCEESADGKLHKPVRRVLHPGGHHIGAAHSGHTPLATGSMDFMTWLYRAMIFLVISCPCALVVSIPLTFYAGIGKSSAIGILVGAATTSMR